MSFEQQKFVALNIAHKRQSIKSNVAAIRLLGCFDDEEQMQEYINEFQQATKRSCIGMQLNELLPLLQDVNDYHKIDKILQERRKELIDYANAKFEETQRKLHAKPNEEEEEEENEEVNEEVNEKVNEPTEKTEEPTEETEEPTEEKQQNTTGIVPYSLRLANRFFLMSAFRDKNSERGEHGFLILGAESTMDLAKKRVEMIRERQQQKNDIHIVQGYRWLSLEEITSPGYIFKHQIPFQHEIIDD